MTDQKLLSAIQERAQNIVIFLEKNGVINDYGIQALRWIEEVIKMRRDVWTTEQKEGFAQNAGAFFGECLIRTFGGEWITTPMGLAVVLNSGKDVLLPFSKVNKFFEHGEVDSFAYMFSVVSQSIKRPPDDTSR